MVSKKKSTSGRGKKPTQKKSAPKKARSVARSPAPQRAAELTCAAAYAAVLANPFAHVSMPPCIPTWPAPHSYKRTTRNRFVMATGANKIGYAVYQPRYYLTGTPSVVTAWTNASFSGTGNTLLLDPINPAVDTTVNRMRNEDTNISARTFIVDSDDTETTTMTKRIVGTGMRIRYIGDNFSQGGVIHVLQRPNGFGQLGATGGYIHATLNDVIAQQSTKRYEVSKSWKTLSYVPIMKDALEYQSPEEMANDHANVIPGYEESGRSYPFFIVAESSSTGALFEIELIQHVECLSSFYSTSYTKSESSDATPRIVSQATEHLPAMGNPEPPVASDPAKDDRATWSRYLRETTMDVGSEFFSRTLMNMMGVGNYGQRMNSVGTGGLGRLRIEV